MNLTINKYVKALRIMPLFFDRVFMWNHIIIIEVKYSHNRDMKDRSRKTLGQIVQM